MGMCMSISKREYSDSKILQAVSIDEQESHQKRNTAVLTLAALGVVFGDIGTSPLYALKECFNPQHGIAFSEMAVYGILSMIFWTFLMVVTLKYVLFVLRANNHGEGGILALMAMALRGREKSNKKTLFIIMLGVFGACLFYGDAVITPAISVLSAVEGLEVISPDFKRFVIPITIGILFFLFYCQKFGTTAVGFSFGPIMLIWFTTLALMGVYNIVEAPQVLMAVNPYYAWHFIVENSMQAFIVMGAVFLVVTGAEALYADMGHFGIRPIQYAWLTITMPCLLLNYFGQGALVIVNPEAIQNPFFMMVPESLTLGLVLLSTLATVIASQATISGAYSMTSQAILLGFLPRMKIIYTSAKEVGQIYMPFINWLLLVIVIWVVTLFRESGNLAAAYGIAVCTTMVVTTLLAALVMKNEWRWPLPIVGVITLVFLCIDTSFLAANLLKIADGGWFPIILGLFSFLLLMTWYQGRSLLRDKLIQNGIPLENFVSSLLKNPPYRVEGTAVFLTAHVDYVPVAMLHNLKHNQVLHQRVIFLKVSIWDVPYVTEERRLSIKDMGQGVYISRAVFGFKETPDVVQIMDAFKEQSQCNFDLMETSFFLARDTIVPSKLAGMALWREAIFAWMFQNAAKPSDFFQIPSNRVVELGSKIEI